MEINIFNNYPLKMFNALWLWLCVINMTTDRCSPVSFLPQFVERNISWTSIMTKYTSNYSV